MLSCSSVVDVAVVEVRRMDKSERADFRFIACINMQVFFVSVLCVFADCNSILRADIERQRPERKEQVDMVGSIPPVRLPIRWANQ